MRPSLEYDDQSVDCLCGAQGSEMPPTILLAFDPSLNEWTALAHDVL